MRFFQYWDAPQPPDEVTAWIEGFKARNPELKHRLYDRDAASWFIRKHFGERERRAFEACAVPSMQSDYFRYCAIETFGGVYADADYEPGAPLATLFDRAPSAMVLTWRGHWVNGLMMFRRPGDPFVQACRRLATENIESRRFDVVYIATGPGILNAIRLLMDPAAQAEIDAGLDNEKGRTWRFPELAEVARRTVPVTPELRAAFASVTVMHHFAADRWLGNPRPSYKATSRHWLHWQGSIYQD